jgi:plasmid stabilization system protein ParE
MAREVVWTDPAWDDLEAAAAYIARDSEFYAASFVQEARDAAASLLILRSVGKRYRNLVTRPSESCL